MFSNKEKIWWNKSMKKKQEKMQTPFVNAAIPYGQVIWNVCCMDFMTLANPFHRGQCSGKIVLSHNLSDCQVKY